MVDGQQTDDKPWLYYKLTNEPKDSGELKSVLDCQLFLYPSILNLFLTPLKIHIEMGNLADIRKDIQILIGLSVVQYGFLKIQNPHQKADI